MTTTRSATTLFVALTPILKNLRGAQITSDHLRSLVEASGVQAEDARTYGMVARMLRDHGIIKETDRSVRSRRPEANKRLIRVWEVA